ncbi:unnamed protein product [Danaus chrysippus]|uniref:(African queen) hypothetical protein n=1 Tax=Danaus chrysippus TaxID=151541 RepID=A0A8J2VRK7_9NEOP|nr:unnamed protein product [Danaus chrysippus]
MVLGDTGRSGAVQSRPSGEPAQSSAAQSPPVVITEASAPPLLCAVSCAYILTLLRTKHRKEPIFKAEH